MREKLEFKFSEEHEKFEDCVTKSDESCKFWTFILEICLEGDSNSIHSNLK